jgi:uncharacterized protein YjbI with pentapeptide repeats
MTPGANMVNKEQLSLLRTDAEGWNTWRANNPDATVDLSGEDLSRANLSGADLIGANLKASDFTWANLKAANLSLASLDRAHLNRANLDGAHLNGAHLNRASLDGASLNGAHLIRADLSLASLDGADLNGAYLDKANLSGASLYETNLRGAYLRETILIGADLYRANLSGANLYGANLITATLVETQLHHAILDNCAVYGVSAWNVALDGATQTNLAISEPNEPSITVDNLVVAQFLYLMLHNAKIRDIIDTLTSKVVLILGRFTPERKTVLNAIREELRKRNYVPVLFDFEGPTSHNFTETVTLLARMARFIIADITDPSSIPQELQAIVPDLEIPVRPLIAKDAQPYATFSDLYKYQWMLPLHHYASRDELIGALKTTVIEPAEAKVIELRKSRRAIDEVDS